MTETKVDKGMKRLAISLVQMANMSRLERCGFIFDDGGCYSFMTIPNVAPNPAQSFFMDPQEQLRCVQMHKNRIIGVFHTHPGGNPAPSADDLAGWHPRMPWRYFIVNPWDVFEYKRGDAGDITLVGSWAGRITKHMVKSADGSATRDRPQDSGWTT